MGKTKKPSLLSHQNYYFVSEGGLLRDPQYGAFTKKKLCPAKRGTTVFFLRRQYV